MSRYRMKPAAIDAIQWSGTNPDEILDFVGNADVPGERAFHHATTASICIPTLAGPAWAARGDYIVQGVDGDFYPIPRRTFEQWYERI